MSSQSLHTIALTGASGMLGSDLSICLRKAGHTVHEFSKKNLNICDPNTFTGLDTIPNLSLLINAAAYTAVDGCESHEVEAFQINAKGPENLALYCEKKHIPFIHFSTDYVFDGTQNTPYLETNTPMPINLYGHSKRAGETAIQSHCKQYYIFRIQWLYGQHGTHFISSILNLAQSNPELRIVSDQFGTPTWTIDVARMVHHVISQQAPWGIYHFRPDGTTHWADYARHILNHKGLKNTVKNITSPQFHRPAKRPSNGCLDTSKIAAIPGLSLPHWKPSLNAFLDL